jgi:hypothetical protein
MSQGHHYSVQVSETVSLYFQMEVNIPLHPKLSLFALPLQYNRNFQVNVHQVEVHEELLHHEWASHLVFEVNIQWRPGEAVEIVIDACLAKRARESLRGLSSLPSVAELARHVH